MLIDMSTCVPYLPHMSPLKCGFQSIDQASIKDLPDAGSYSECIKAWNEREELIGITISNAEQTVEDEEHPSMASDTIFAGPITDTSMSCSYVPDGTSPADDMHTSFSPIADLVNTDFMDEDEGHETSMDNIYETEGGSIPEQTVPEDDEHPSTTNTSMNGKELSGVVSDNLLEGSHVQMSVQDTRSCQQQSDVVSLKSQTYEEADQVKISSRDGTYPEPGEDDMLTFSPISTFPDLPMTDSMDEVEGQETSMDNISETHGGPILGYNLRKAADRNAPRLYATPNSTHLQRLPKPRIGAKRQVKPSKKK